MDDLMQLLCVYVDDDCYGIPTACVQEVLREMRLTPVPLAPPAIAGLINLRGQIVVTMSLRQLLGRPVEQGRPCGSLIVKTERETVNVLVDRVEDVISLSPEQLVPFESTKDAPLLTGIYKTTDRLIHVLDAHALMTGITSHHLRSDP